MLLASSSVYNQPDELVTNGLQIFITASRYRLNRFLSVDV